MSSGPDFEATRRKLRFLVLAMAVGVLLFAGVAVWLVAGGALGTPEPLPPGIVGMVAVGVLVMLLVSPVVERKLAAVPAGSDAALRLRRWSTATIVGSALREGAGLLGVALASMAGSIPWVLAFGGISAGAILLAFPKGEEVEAALRSVR